MFPGLMCGKPDPETLASNKRAIQHLMTILDYDRVHIQSVQSDFSFHKYNSTCTPERPGRRRVYYSFIGWNAYQCRNDPWLGRGRRDADGAAT